MQLKSIFIENYKSFYERRKVEIGEGFNLFLGANNSGKTTLLEALDLVQGRSVPHRSSLSLPTYGAVLESRVHSSLQVSIETSISELRELCGDEVMIPIPIDFKDRILGMDHAEGAFRLISGSPEIVINLDFRDYLQISVKTTFGLSSNVAYNQQASTHVLQLTYSSGKNDFPICRVVNFTGHPVPLKFNEIFKRFFYRFSAQRNSTGKSGFTNLPVALAPDANNLAFCLSQLQASDAHGHSELCAWVNRIFPSINWVQAPIVDNNQWGIECLPCKPQDRRDDLAIPLHQMGTGIGNVLAILYVVKTARRPQVIAIDEPNSFLHPRALRELLQILAAEGKNHQYILTAHSAEVLTAIKPTWVTMFSSFTGQTTVRQVPGIGVADLRVELSDLGIRMTDLHGRDRVLWVEGQTEELVIPELLQFFCPQLAAGTAVLRVEHTGTFDKKKGISAAEVAKIYKRLSSSSALVPPMVGILLDRENKTSAECEKIENESSGILRFLEKTMLEDYVLDPTAIASVLLDLGEKCNEEMVKNIIMDEANKEKNAADKLAEVFTKISSARHIFRKTSHTPKIVIWLLNNNPLYLQPLGNFLNNIIERDLKV
ncbi:AAA family ATPase [Janthinobacterium sp.]|uniref:ATP-dependent nuclease n=1 Tax=Janthinobacterium sp. TaxID=1871054 RepID=UPI0025BA881F|nr:AAA family ATPase [Janthinobacterium sp.]NBV18349.1 hypothetical protein [Janthinobacterium sp.]